MTTLPTLLQKLRLLWRGRRSFFMVLKRTAISFFLSIPLTFSKALLICPYHTKLHFFFKWKSVNWSKVSKILCTANIYDRLQREYNIPEVSWVGLLLEGMEGFLSPFESLRTILWYWSPFSVGLYDVKNNPTEKQLVILLFLLLLKKKLSSTRDRTWDHQIRSQTLYQMSYWGLVEKVQNFLVFYT